MIDDDPSYFARRTQWYAHLMASRLTWFERDITPKPQVLLNDTMRGRLLAAVLASPDDDLPRLVLADALIEHGDPRGEFIIVQCELHRHRESEDARTVELRGREAELIAKHKKAWVGRFGGTRTEYGTQSKSWVKGSPTRWTFERGFVRDVTMSPNDFARNAEALFAAEPVIRVHVTGSDIAPALNCKGLQEVRELDLSRNRLKEAGMRALFCMRQLGFVWPLPGAVIFIQNFTGALLVHPHFHGNRSGVAGVIRRAHRPDQFPQ